MAITKYGTGWYGYGRFFLNTYEHGFQRAIITVCANPSEEQNKLFDPIKKKNEEKANGIANILKDMKMFVVFDDSDNRWHDYFSGEPVNIFRAPENSYISIEDVSYKEDGFVFCGSSAAAELDVDKIKDPTLACMGLRFCLTDELSAAAFSEKVSAMKNIQIKKNLKKVKELKKEADKYIAGICKVVNEVKAERDKIARSVEEKQQAINSRYGKFK